MSSSTKWTDVPKRYASERRMHGLKNPTAKLGRSPLTSAMRQPSQTRDTYPTRRSFDIRFTMKEPTKPGLGSEYTSGNSSFSLSSAVMGLVTTPDNMPAHNPSRAVSFSSLMTPLNSVHVWLDTLILKHRDYRRMSDDLTTGIPTFSACAGISVSDFGLANTSVTSP